jgi:hypothetical protein
MQLNPWRISRCASLRLIVVFPIAMVVALFLFASAARAVDTLGYSFETLDEMGRPGGFHNNGGGTTVTQDTIGATEGTKSMKVSIVGGATFVGAQTEFFGDFFGDPPGFDHIHFDMTITQRFDIPNPTPPPDRLGFARIGVIVFGVTQPDFPGGQLAVQAQLANLAEDEVPIGGLEPGTYKDRRIDLDKLTDPITFETKAFNQIFGTEGSGPNDIIPTSWEFYFNKTGGAEFPLTVYIDNVRFGNSVLGDYDGNDVVDAADYVLWRNGGPLRNEVADVGTVSPADYDEWRARFGNTSGSGNGGVLSLSPVPEPGSALLLLVAAVCGWGTRRD